VGGRSRVGIGQAERATAFGEKDGGKESDTLRQRWRADGRKSRCDV